ncbi:MULTISPECIES: peptide-methionine (S)-S-oxide reductase MsrA [Glutamicibacter]|uniref:Peptide methionine sulfoxide reductase MsrA n=2 Tax=Glutamicibacter arilaitensis TaxID=256701 RepID=A0A2N7S4H4_9MICC|nr:MULTISPECIES: peptide-methionine (S)-S-oxide reductase MsrA [Glutamicibacter]PMQ21024.1 peptide-methionine (S)-S-oxide reductase [Glutamicibacter arilaitensis]CBT75787.1 peptide-methionine (S)-S-oxide reductase [Glutamicibacter arilaitensis Re117]HCH47012.1 peptide-methionine (S)-S-oxide reductase [Glutamicibacter sp.]HCJ55136.1 peptide-methionine (S)-S-oxide reductase [Glutamicibacter sp.]HCM95470.1 peptide-methionine (S)-S-oxide reductase [Glutamicibacter sp.]
MQRRNVVNNVSILSLQSPHQFSPSLEVQGTKLTTFVLAGGCFWCLDAVYQRTRGVYAVISGYIGGHTADPQYREVCSGMTGHAEAVAVIFDAAVVPEEIILDMFFTVHDPTTLNRQGYDVGTQYRSAMFPLDDQQRELFEQSIQKFAGIYPNPIVTTMEESKDFYPAEQIHQDYYSANQEVGYCRVIIDPKLVKVRKYYAQWLNEA